MLSGNYIIFGVIFMFILCSIILLIDFIRRADVKNNKNSDNSMLDEMTNSSLTNQTETINNQIANEVNGVVGTDISGMNPTYRNNNNSL